MRLFALVFSCLLLAKAYPDSESKNKDVKWRITKSSPLFSCTAEFNFKKGDVSQGKAFRTGLFCPRYFYDLYDCRNNFEARGITRAISWGMLASWGMEIDVYDAASAYVGLIQGQFLTKSRAKFIFYTARGEMAGAAYLDTNSSDFIIVSPVDESLIMAKLKGKTFGDLTSWEMKAADIPLTIDERLLKIFSAFVSDYHDYFDPPAEPAFHYHYQPQPTNYQ